MEFDDLKHAQRQRLIYLDRCFTWRGMAKRSDLMERFGISSAQAALDFRLYIERANRKAPIYDAVQKTYVSSPNHRPLVPSTLADAFHTVLVPNDDASATLPLPDRKADTKVVSRLYRAMKSGEAIHIRYTSMTSGADGGQWIAPTHFSSDGESVHIRAFSFKHLGFRDYLPIRIEPDSTFDTRLISEALPEDIDWNTRALIWLRPKSSLSSYQADVVRREYGFDEDLLCLVTRKALEFYFNRRWGIDQPGGRLERVRTDYEKLTS